MHDRGSGALTQWAVTAWMKCPGLSEEVKTQLRKTTKEIANLPRNEFSTYLRGGDRMG